MSQFWYDDDTATKIAEEAEKRSGGGGIAFLSCPTAFLQFKKMYPERENVVLLEFDRRFAAKCPAPFRFEFYDFNKPLALPENLKGKFDYLVADPPYLDPNTMGKFIETMDWMATKPNTDANRTMIQTHVGASAPAQAALACESIVTPIMFLTGATLEETALAHGLRPVEFRPTFSCKLSNLFHCYLNYVSGNLGQFLDLEE